jgi:hypothetical protein
VHLCKAGLTNNDAYFRMQGLNPDGTPNPAYPNLVDVVNLIDYMLVIVYAAAIWTRHLELPWQHQPQQLGTVCATALDRTVPVLCP